MARRRKTSEGILDRAATGIGSAMGSIAGKIDVLQTDHPHPIDEARAALITGQEALAEVASNARMRARTVVKKAKAVASQTKKTAARLRPKKKPRLVRAANTAKKATAKAVTRAKKVVARGRKTVARAARRLKKR